MSLKAARELLVKVILADWDGISSFPVHVHNWYDPQDPYRYGLMMEARGNWFRPSEPLPYRVLKRWANELNIELPKVPKLYRAGEKRALLAILLRDWDRHKPLADHVRDWQDLSDPLKYQLIQQALGQRFRVAPIPLTTIQQWIRQLGIQVPRSKRTQTPSRRTLIRWKQNEDRRRIADGGPRPLDTS